MSDLNTMFVFFHLIPKDNSFRNRENKRIPTEEYPSTVIDILSPPPTN